MRAEEGDGGIRLGGDDGPDTPPGGPRPRGLAALKQPKAASCPDHSGSGNSSSVCDHRGCEQRRQRDTRHGRWFSCAQAKLPSRGKAGARRPEIVSAQRLPSKWFLNVCLQSDPAQKSS